MKAIEEKSRCQIVFWEPEERGAGESENRGAGEPESRRKKSRFYVIVVGP